MISLRCAVPYKNDRALWTKRTKVSILNKIMGWYVYRLMLRFLTQQTGQTERGDKSRIFREAI